MNTTTDTAASAAKADALTVPAKTARLERRMARPTPAAEAAPPSEAVSATNLPAHKPATGSKTSSVIALLEREGGATLAELIAATSWLPHTTRAALTGLRKKGHVIERSKRGDETCYRIAPRASDSVKPA